MIDDRLCSLDHHLKFQTALGETSLLFEFCEQRRKRRYLFRDRDLRQGHYEVVWQPPITKLHETGNENVERPDAASTQLFVKRLDANADEWRQCAVLISLGHFRRRGSCVAVFLVVRTIPVAIFKVDA